jgi:hypothetical protein
LLPGSWYQWFWSTTCSCHDMLSHRKPKSNESLWLWTRTSKTMNPNNLFALVS